MSRGYERRQARREAERQRSLCGETLAEFHRKETAPPPTLTEIYRSHPKVRCERTPNLFTGLTDEDLKRPNLDLFKEPK